MADIDHIFPPTVDPRPAALKRSGWYFEPPDEVDRSGALPGHTLRLVRTGEEMDDERWRLIAQAKRSLYISAYAWKNDNVGLALVDAVCRKIRKSKGKLEVKIIVENFGSKELRTGSAKQLRAAGELFASKRPPRGALLLQSCGAPIVFYRPRREDWQNLMQVRHEKLFIIDGHTMLTGGSNIGDHYHMASPRSGKWYDLDLHVKGPLACWYHNQFQKSWRRVVSQDMGIELDGLSRGQPLRGLTQAKRDTIYGLKSMERCNMSAAKKAGPSHLYGIMGRPVSNHKRPILDSYLRAIGEAKHSISLYAPYFVPAHPFSRALIAARKRGIKVTIITNSPESLDEDNLIFSAMLLSVFHKYEEGSLVENGIDVRIWTRKATLHRKGGIFDPGDSQRQKLFMGSDNLDVRGQEYSSESVVWTDDSKLIAELNHDFLQDIKSSKPLTIKYRDEYLATQRGSMMGRLKLWVAEHFRNFF
jgi:cardiolipin synthase